MKRVLICLFTIIIAACGTAPQEARQCPLISVPKEMSRIYQTFGHADKFQITLSGYESYCYTEQANNRRYAVITPIFKVRRLEPDTTTSLDVNFYVKTSVNAEDYLGIRHFSQKLDIPLNAKEVTIVGRQTKTRIANPPYDGFTISLGLVLSPEDLAKAQKMLDIDYRYLSAEELSGLNQATPSTVYIEVSPDEEIIYSDIDNAPQVVKKDRPKGNCCN